MRVSTLIAMLLLGSMMPLSGCAIASLAGGMAQNAEYQKLLRVHAEYSGLEHERVAVLVNAEHSLYYQFPLVRRLASGPNGSAGTMWNSRWAASRRWKSRTGVTTWPCFPNPCITWPIRRSA